MIHIVYKKRGLWPPFLFLPESDQSGFTYSPWQTKCLFHDIDQSFPGLALVQLDLTMYS